MVNLIIAAHLNAEADARLSSRLEELRHQRSAVAAIANRTSAGADGDPDDTNEAPILGWVVSPDHRVVADTLGAPGLPVSLTTDPRTGEALTVSLGNAGAFRLKTAADGRDVLVAGISLDSKQRVQQWVLLGEVAAAPVLLLAMFAGALLIGLRAQAPVEHAHRRQLEFTADASHELRTPLSVIRAEADLALDDPDIPADHKDTLLRIRREGERLGHLVEDMLWLARSDSHPPPADEGPVNLATVARQEADRFRSVGPAVTADAPDGAVFVTAPTGWADRLTGVLLDNACRYAGPDGQVRISVAANGNRATLTVQDSGPGIPAELRPRLFDRFARATEKGSGTGLGLAIADSVVRSTGGRWEVGDSAALGGARLAVTWRLAQPHPSSSSLRPQRAPGPALCLRLRLTVVGPRRRQTDQQVVGHQRDRQVHEKQHGDGLGGLALEEDVDVGQPQHQRDQHRQPQEEPAGIGRDPRHRRPGRAGDDHADHGQLGVVAELKVRVPRGGGEHSLGDEHEQGVGGQGPSHRGDGGQDHPGSLGLPVPRVKVEPGQRCERIEHVRKAMQAARSSGPM